jgi:hypothetical protein
MVTALEIALEGVIVSVGALALTLCVALITLFGGQPLELPDQNRFPCRPV